MTPRRLGISADAVLPSIVVRLLRCAQPRRTVLASERTGPTEGADRAVDNAAAVPPDDRCALKGGKSCRHRLWPANGPSPVPRTAWPRHIHRSPVPGPYLIRLPS